MSSDPECLGKRVGAPGPEVGTLVGQNALMAAPRTRLSGPTVDSNDPRSLARFYETLLGWKLVACEPARPGLPPEDGWARIESPSGEQKIEFQWTPDYVAPVWPPASGRQQMMIHLDIAAEDLEAAVAWAVDAGATVAAHQPQEGVRVMIDPAGHPFCLFQGEV